MSGGVLTPCRVCLKWCNSGMDAPCQHARTEVVARRDGVDYVCCLDCHQIFEAEDLDPAPSLDDEEPSS